MLSNYEASLEYFKRLRLIDEDYARLILVRQLKDTSNHLKLMRTRLEILDCGRLTFSLCPCHKEISSWHETLKNVALHSPANARAICVFPFPGGPYRRIERGALFKPTKSPGLSNCLSGSFCFPIPFLLVVAAIFESACRDVPGNIFCNLLISLTCEFGLRTLPALVTALVHLENNTTNSIYFVTFVSAISKCFYDFDEAYWYFIIEIIVQQTWSKSRKVADVSYPHIVVSFFLFCCLWVDKFL